MIFVQREGTTGTVRFTGDLARVLDSSGNVVRDWTPGGVLSGIPQGDGYTLEVLSGTTVKADPLAIGAVVFVMGQSNIQRWFDTPPGGVSAPRVYNMEWDGKIGTAVTGSAAQHFTQGYAAALGVPVMVVEGARGGTALTPEADKGNGHWFDTSGGSLYANMLSRLQQVGGRAELVLWGQGETDASANVGTDRYAAVLNTFMERVLADFQPSRVLIQELGPHGTDPGKYDLVRAAQHIVANNMALVDIGASTTDTNTIEDGIHLTGASRVLAADRMLINALAIEGIHIARALQTGTDDALAGDNLAGGAGRDELRGLTGNDTLSGDAGSDVLLGGAGADSILGGDGSDIIRGDAGEDRIDAGAGDDAVSGGDNADSILGGDGRDEIWADAGEDTIAGGSGNDLIFGGAGTDTAVFTGARSGYAILLSGTMVRVTDINLADGNDGVDELRGVEFLRFTDMTVDPRGVALQPLFSDSADVIDFAGIVAGTYTAASYYAAMGGDDEVYLPVDSTAALHAGYDLKRSFDAGAGDDVVIGSSVADTIFGGSGADILNGRGGADRLVGGMGDDKYFVDNTKDVILESAGEGFDVVTSTVSLTLRDNVENLFLSGTGSLAGTGNAGANLITGTIGGNRLLGMAGNDTILADAGIDTLDGGAGVDSLVGGAGNDRYLVDDALDVVVELTGEGTDEVQSSAVTYTLGANVERLLLLGSGNISGIGNSLDNRLTGNSGDNTLDGGSGRDSMAGGAGNDLLIGGLGNDSLQGGLGMDTLTGGGGNDRFLFRTLEEAVGADPNSFDVITDFSRGDKIDLSGVDAVSGTSSNELFAFRGTAEITGAGQLRCVQQGGNTFVYGHVDGDGVADFTIVLTGGVSLIASDFVL